MTNLTLELFNAVKAKPSKQTPFVSTKEGVIIMPNALWAKENILSYYERNRFDGNSLNKTFYKNWKTVKNLTPEQRFIDQMLHYMSTYGTDFTGEIYMPNDEFNLPENVKLKFKVVNGLTNEELIEKGLDVLRSGIALKEETIDSLINIIHDSGYVFTGKEGIKNKEANVKIADMFGVYPDQPEEFLRYLIYKATDQTLLIKNDELINQIKNSSFSAAYALNNYDLVKLSEIFNRFKPIFLAFKKPNTAKVINKISKLSKTHHKPLVSNALSEVTQRKLNTSDKHWLENATPYALFKALNACYARKEGQDVFLYQVRNGKSWVEEKSVKNIEVAKQIAAHNFTYILNYLQSKYDFSGTNVYIPKNVEYALPSSEKMYVGNIPMGTRFYGKHLNVGIYWENSWGARDLDLSSINVGGKVGWNASYKQSGNSIIFSGDITNAPNGAVEYIRATKNMFDPTVVMNNVYNGDDNAGFKIIVGKGNEVNENFMMNPDNLFVDIKTTMPQKQAILGFFMNKYDKQCFILMNTGQGAKHVSRTGEISDMTIKALYQKYNNYFTVNDLLSHLGAKFVDSEDKGDLNLSMENLERDTFVKLFL